MRVWPLISIPVVWLMQAVFAGRVAAPRAVADLPLLLSVCVGMILGPDAGVTVGFGAGLLEDLSAGRYIGLHALSKGACGFAAGYVGRRILPDRFIVPFLSVVGATFVEGAVVYSVLRLTGSPVSLHGRLTTMLAAAAYNGCLGPVAMSVFSAV
ncbi:MAG: rod shape-determining protein MreD, partial [Firmicutes bacterium]|nr:rod shape-determining protein MreD [Bacillota bacterium]